MLKNLSWTRLVLPLAWLKLAAGLAALVVTYRWIPEDPFFPRFLFLFFFLEFGGSATLLLLGGRQDSRAVALGSFFLVAATAWCGTPLYRAAEHFQGPAIELATVLKALESPFPDAGLPLVVRPRLPCTATIRGATAPDRQSHHDQRLDRAGVARCQPPAFRVRTERPRGRSCGAPPDPQADARTGDLLQHHHALDRGRPGLPRLETTLPRPGGAPACPRVPPGDRRRVRPDAGRDPAGALRPSLQGLHVPASGLEARHHRRLQPLHRGRAPGHLLRCARSPRARHPAHRPAGPPLCAGPLFGHGARDGASARGGRLSVLPPGGEAEGPPLRGPAPPPADGQRGRRHGPALPEGPPRRGRPPLLPRAVRRAPDPHPAGRADPGHRRRRQPRQPDRAGDRPGAPPRRDHPAGGRPPLGDARRPAPAGATAGHFVTARAACLRGERSVVDRPGRPALADREAPRQGAALAGGQRLQADRAHPGPGRVAAGADRPGREEERPAVPQGGPPAPARDRQQRRLGARARAVVHSTGGQKRIRLPRL